MRRFGLTQINAEFTLISMDKPQINKESSLIHVFRWFAVLPGSIVCAVLVMFPIHWAVMLIQFACKEGDTIEVEGPMGLLACVPPEMLERFGYALFTPMVMIITGAKIAPKYNFQTGIGMAVFWGLIFGAASTITISHGWFFGWGWFRFAIIFVLGTTGVVFGLLQVHQKQKKTEDRSMS